MSPERDLPTIRREKADPGGALAFTEGQADQGSTRSLLLCCEQLRGQSVQGAEGNWEAAGRSSKGTKGQPTTQ